MNLIIRKTDKSEFFQTENITREAFWNLYAPGCTEHLVLHQLRKSKGYIGELDLLAYYNEQIVAHIISTKAKVIDNQNNENEVLCVGPFSVLPSIQKKGIGSQLLNHSISEAKQLGFKGMILFGNPDYYRRFNFRNAEEYQITTKDFQNFDPFMALELYKDGLSNTTGRFFEDEAFITTEENLSAFDKNFPVKQKGKIKLNIHINK